MVSIKWIGARKMCWCAETLLVCSKWAGALVPSFFVGARVACLCYEKGLCPFERSLGILE